MTDYFKTIRAYLRGKWGRKREGEPFRGICPNDTRISEGLARLAMMGPIIRESSGPFLTPANLVKVYELRREISRLRRNKKKHSHLQKQLDDLLNGGAQISDQQTETTK